MVWIRKKQKYNQVGQGDEDVEIFNPSDELKTPLFTPAQVRAALVTSVLLAIYFAPSIGLTFYQRWLLQKFNFPLSVVLIHLIVKLMLSAIWRCCASWKNETPKLVIPFKDNLTKIAPPGLFSGIDIGFSNWGLELITVSLYTMTKSSAIVFILGFAILFKLEKKTWTLWITVIMISVGLTLFTYRSTQIDIFGFILVLIASMSSGLRWTCVQLLLQKSKMGMRNPADMIYYMQPWMIIIVLFFATIFEGPTVYENLQIFPSQDLQEYFLLLLKILIGACIAFFMEMSEVLVVTYTSSLTLSVAGIFKEVLVLILAHFMNGDQMSFMNVMGLIVCLTGITFHVVHKIYTADPRSDARHYGGETEHLEMGQKLIENGPAGMHLSSDSDDDENNSEEIFNIIHNRHDR